MSGFLFGAKKVDVSVQDDIEEVFRNRTGARPHIYETGQVFLLSSRENIDQGSVKVAFNGYLLDVDRGPEEHIAAAYRRHGPDFAKHIDGAFRVLIYDTDNNKFHASTDRAGRKVIYYSVDSNNFLCSSHLTPLLRHPDIEPELNPVGVSDYLKSWSVSFAGGERLVKNVSRLYPSHCLAYKNGEAKQRWFWDVGRDKRQVSDAEAVKRMDELLTEGAEKLVEQASDPFNVFLSGGFDSTFLVALLREITDKTIHTYTWGWQDQHFDDALEMSDLYGTQHNEIRQEYMFPTDEELWFYEEPHNAFVRYPFHQLYQEYGLQSYWTGLNSQATFPVCLKNLRRLDRIRFSEPFFKSMPTHRTKQFLGSKLSYKASKAVEILESEHRSTAAVIDWGISQEDVRKLLSTELREKGRNLEAFIDDKWQLSWDSYQENYSYLQLRMRDTARYAYYAQDFDHYDVYGYLPLLEYSYSLPMSQKKNRRLLQKIAKGRVPDRIITKGASGWDFVSRQFRRKIIENEDEYRSKINSFIDRGMLERNISERILLPDDFNGLGRGRVNQMIAVYLLERWISLFIEQEEPWRPL